MDKTPLPICLAPITNVSIEEKFVSVGEKTELYKTYTQFFELGVNFYFLRESKEIKHCAKECTFTVYCYFYMKDFVCNPETDIRLQINSASIKPDEMFAVSQYIALLIPIGIQRIAKLKVNSLRAEFDILAKELSATQQNLTEALNELKSFHGVSNE